MACVAIIADGLISCFTNCKICTLAVSCKALPHDFVRGVSKYVVNGLKRKKKLQIERCRLFQNNNLFSSDVLFSNC